MMQGGGNVMCYISELMFVIAGLSVTGAEGLHRFSWGLWMHLEITTSPSLIKSPQAL